MYIYIYIYMYVYTEAVPKIDKGSFVLLFSELPSDGTGESEDGIRCMQQLAFHLSIWIVTITVDSV
jgi:hypothetical protein